MPLGYDGQEVAKTNKTLTQTYAKYGFIHNPLKNSGISDHCRDLDI